MADDLVARLRAEDPETGLRWSIASEAADRIEQLEGVLRQLANPPKGIAFGGKYTILAMETARAALEGKDD